MTSTIEIVDLVRAKYNTGHEDLLISNNDPRLGYATNLHYALSPDAAR